MFNEKMMHNFFKEKNLCSFNNLQLQLSAFPFKQEADNNFNDICIFNYHTFFVSLDFPKYSTLEVFHREQ